MIWSVPRISVGKEEREGHLGRESSLSKGVKRCPSVVQQGDSKLCVMALVVGGHGDKGGVMGAVRLYRQVGSGWLCRGQWRAWRRL